MSCYHIATSYVTMLLASPEHMFLLQSKRACFPKLEAIKLATADIVSEHSPIFLFFFPQCVVMMVKIKGTACTILC